MLLLIVIVIVIVIVTWVYYRHSPEEIMLLFFLCFARVTSISSICYSIRGMGRLNPSREIKFFGANGDRDISLSLFS